MLTVCSRSGHIRHQFCRRTQSPANSDPPGRFDPGTKPTPWIGANSDGTRIRFPWMGPARIRHPVVSRHPPLEGQQPSASVGPGTRGASSEATTGRGNDPCKWDRFRKDTGLRFWSAQTRRAADRDPIRERPRPLLVEHIKPSAVRQIITGERPKTGRATLDFCGLLAARFSPSVSDRCIQGQACEAGTVELFGIMAQIPVRRACREYRISVARLPHKEVGM